MFDWLRRKAKQPPKSKFGPISFTDWTEEEIKAMSAAIRKNGQPDHPGFDNIARIALNTMRGASATEMVARQIEECLNPGLDPDRPIEFGHYLAGLPSWCMWVEYAKPAVEYYHRRYKHGSV